MIRNRWKRGPAMPGRGPVVVSATRFLYRRWSYLPLVWFHGWRLRRGWGRRRGAVGLFTAVEAGRPVTYSLSAWESEADLRRFLRAPEHLELMRAFRNRLADSRSVVWEMEGFSPESAWREAQARLRRPPAAPATSATSAGRRPGSAALP